MNTTARRIAASTAIATVALGVLFALGLLIGLVHVYNGQNAGIVVGTETNNVGYEWRTDGGTPGWFVDGR